MNQIIILVVVIAIVIVVMLTSRKEQVSEVQSEKESRSAKQDAWAKESVVTYGEVQKMREELIKAVEEKLRDEPEHVKKLKKIVDDWANLKVESFKERRSWVRSPEKDS